MAGRKNHILPKLLMRGFCIDPQKKAETVYVFKNSQKPFLSSLDKIGAKRDYYELNGSTFIDDKMNITEGRYANSINKIRNTNKLAEKDNTLLNDFAFDLYTRSNNFVKELEKSFLELVRSISSEKHIDHLIEISIRRAIGNAKTRIINQLIQSAIIEHGQSKVKRLIPQIRKQVTIFLESPSFHETSKILLQSIIPLVKEQISKKIGEAVKLGQLQTLTDRYTEPENYLNFNFRWILSNPHEKRVILGDVGPLFASSAGVTALLWVKGKIDAVYLPLSSKMLAIGSTESYDKDIPADDINNASALFSSDFFIASEKNDDNMQLSKLIGENDRHLQSIDTSINDWLGKQISQLYPNAN